MNQVLSHVAILVPSVKKAADYLAQFGFHIGELEEFEGEGTREIYIESQKGNSLLLMEPLGFGPYKRAMEKRGPGLHHIGIDVLDLSGYLESLSESGWLLHPMSIKTMASSQTLYLARPGFPGLIEVHQKKKLPDKSFFVTGMMLKMDPVLARLLKPIGLDNMIKISSSSSDELILFDGRKIPLKDLF